MRVDYVTSICFELLFPRTIKSLFALCVLSLIVCHCGVSYLIGDNVEKSSLHHVGGGGGDGIVSREIVAARTTDVLQKNEGVFSASDERGKRVKRRPAAKYRGSFGRDFVESWPVSDAPPAQRVLFSAVIQFPAALMENIDDPVLSELLAGKRASKTRHVCYVNPIQAEI